MVTEVGGRNFEGAGTPEGRNREGAGNPEGGQYSEGGRNPDPGGIKPDLTLDVFGDTTRSSTHTWSISSSSLSATLVPIDSLEGAS